MLKRRALNIMFAGALLGVLFILITCNGVSGKELEEKSIGNVQCGNFSVKSVNGNLVGEVYGTEFSLIDNNYDILCDDDAYNIVLEDEKQFANCSNQYVFLDKTNNVQYIAFVDEGTTATTVYTIPLGD